jgi:osmotically-inducible protein OsmY
MNTVMSNTAVDLKDKVLNELKWEPGVNEAEIGVIVKDGVVTLTGRVESCTEKVAAEQATQRVSGVRAVANELQITLTSREMRTDSDIASAAASALQWHSSLPRGVVRVSVDQGWITLTGRVDWHYQRLAAERAVRHLLGVRGVINDVRVAPHATPAEVKRTIVAALERHALLDADRITVDAEGGRVILRGAVDSLAEKSEAGWAACSAPGVSEVRNEIEVR